VCEQVLELYKAKQNFILINTSNSHKLMELAKERGIQEWGKNIMGRSWGQIPAIWGSLAILRYQSVKLSTQLCLGEFVTLFLWLSGKSLAESL